MNSGHKLEGWVGGRGDGCREQVREDGREGKGESQHLYNPGSKLSLIIMWTSALKRPPSSNSEVTSALLVSQGLKCTRQGSGHGQGIHQARGSRVYIAPMSSHLLGRTIRTLEAMPHRENRLHLQRLWGRALDAARGSPA